MSARDARRGGDAGECVQMRDGVMTMHTRRTRPRHRRDARRARRSRRASDRPTSSTRRLSLARETRRARNADSAWRFVDRASFEKSEYRMRFAVKRAAEKRDFVDSARRCRSTRGRFFFIGGIREITSQLARRFPSHPRKPARDSSHETRVSASDVAWDVRRHSRTARVQALRSASRRASPELSSLRARAQRARVVRTETDARARVPAGYAASRISAFFSASHGTVQRSDTDSPRWPPARSPHP